jgi:hypothetical protein
MIFYFLDHPLGLCPFVDLGLPLYLRCSYRGFYCVVKVSGVAVVLCWASLPRLPDVGFRGCLDCDLLLPYQIIGVDSCNWLTFGLKPNHRCPAKILVAVPVSVRGRW